MLFKILSFLVAVGFSTTVCTPYPEPRASSVISGHVLRSSVEVPSVTYQQSTQLVPAAYAYSAFPTAPLAATNSYQHLVYTTSPYYVSPITAALPPPPPLSYSLTPSTYIRSVTQQYVPVASAPLTTPGVAPTPYSYRASAVPLATPGIAPAAPLATPGIAPAAPLATPGIAPAQYSYPATATPLATPGGAPVPYSYPSAYSSSIPSAERSLAMTQAVGAAGQYLG